MNRPGGVGYGTTQGSKCAEGYEWYQATGLLDHQSRGINLAPLPGKYEANTERVVMDGRRNGMRAAEIMGRSQLGVFESGPELLGGAVNNNKAGWCVRSSFTRFS